MVEIRQQKQYYAHWGGLFNSLNGNNVLPADMVTVTDTTSRTRGRTFIRNGLQVDYEYLV